jgi:hypothetical protein
MAARWSMSGDTPLYFCSLNSRDFEPTAGNDLAAEYGELV